MSRERVYRTQHEENLELVRNMSWHELANGHTPRGYRSIPNYTEETQTSREKSNTPDTLASRVAVLETDVAKLLKLVTAPQSDKKPRKSPKSSAKPRASKKVSE